MKLFLVRTIILALFAVGLTWQQWRGEATQPPNDFGFFWTTAQFMKIYHRTDIYSEQGEQDINAAQPQPSGAFYTVTQTPFLYSFVSAISSGNYDTDGKRFHAICLLSFILSVGLFCWLSGYRADWALALYLALLWGFAPIAMDADVASVNRIQLGLVAVAAFCLTFRKPAGHFASGVFLGLGVMLKPNTLFVPFFLLLSRGVRREWRLLGIEAGGCLAGGLFGFACGALLFGSASSWFVWAERMKRLPMEASPLNLLDFSLPVLLNELTGAKLATPVMLVLFPLAAWLLYRVTREWQREPEVGGATEAVKAPGAGGLAFDLQIIAAASLVYLLSAGLVWNHYYTFTIPAIVVLLSPAGRQKAGIVWSVAALVAAIALGAHLLLVKAGLLLVSGFLCWGAAALLFLLITARPIPARNRLPK